MTGISGELEQLTSRRTLFIKKYLELLETKEIEYSIVRGYQNLFDERGGESCKGRCRDIDLVVSPRHFERAELIFRKLIQDTDATFISSAFLGKNLFLKALFVNEGKGHPRIEGVYFHLTAFVRVKTSFHAKEGKFGSHRRIWIDDLGNMEAEIGGSIVKVPSKKMQIILLLTKYTRKERPRYLHAISAILKDGLLDDWMEGKDNNRLLRNIHHPECNILVSPLVFDLIKTLTEDVGIKDSNTRLADTFLIIWYTFKSIFKYKGKLIFFSGPDGSGKTTANENLTELLTNNLRISVTNSKHLLPLSKRTVGHFSVVQAKVRKLNFDDKGALERDRGKGVKWRARRLGGLMYILIQVWPGYIHARYKNLRGHTVIIDTSFFDAFVKGHRPEFPILQWLVAPLVPRGEQWVLMAARP